MSSSITLDSSGASFKEESPRNRSSSFSISAILSDDIGGPKRPSFSQTPPSTSSLNYQTHTPKRPRDIPQSSLAKRPAITLTQAGGIVSPKSSTSQGLPNHPVAGTTPSMRHNMSISSSPLNPSLLQQSSDKEEFLSDSLGMLSEVAMFHNELGSSLETPVRERVADLQITSTCEGSDRSGEWNGADPVINLSQRAPSRHRTPSILKRRSRKASRVSESSGDESLSKDKPNYLNTGFLSPLANEKSALTSQQSGFSPSIFLSRPDESQNQSTKQSFSDSESNQEDGIPPSDDFTTSTPIKQDKENLISRERQPPRCSPNILRRGRKQLLKDSNESGSDSENPVKRPRSSPLSPPNKKKSKARTKLSPLLENACSPIPKADHTPSPLMQSTTPTRPLNLNLEPARAPLPITHPVVERPGFLNPASLHLLSQAQPTCVIPQVYPAPAPYPMQQPLVAPLQRYSTIISPTHQYHRPILSPTLINQPNLVRVPFYVSPNTSGFVPVPVVPPSIPYGVQPSQSFVPRPGTLVGSIPQSIPNASFQGSVPGYSRNEGLKSVPPRFIFSNMKPEGKRSRLTEAINKSLSETPMETTKLPSEWTKYACGQTNDQRDLTSRAKSFMLHCKPRALNFEGDT